MFAKTLLASSVGVAAAGGPWMIGGNKDGSWKRLGATKAMKDVATYAVADENSDEGEMQHTDEYASVEVYGQEGECVVEPDTWTVSDYMADPWGAESDDSHNGVLSVCELTWKQTYYTGEVVTEKCCIESGRVAMVDACTYIFDAYGWDDAYIPPMCEDDLDDGIHTDCGGSYYGGDVSGGGVASAEVSQVTSYYHALDYSYNPTETSLTLDFTFDDTTPPVLSIPEGEDLCWTDTTTHGDDVDVCGYTVEKCTYFDLPEVSAFDTCDTAPTMSYECWSPTVDDEVVVTLDTDDGALNGWTVVTQGFPSSDDIDAWVVGTHACTYSATDAGTANHMLTGEGGPNNAAELHFLVVVTDESVPEVTFEENDQVVECAIESDIPDPDARCWNEPCTDEWTIHDSHLTALYALSDDFSECVDSDTFDIGWGGCDTYVEGGSNDGYCEVDGADATGACPVSCGTCVEEYECEDSDSFDVGYGDCSTYAYGESNNDCDSWGNCWDYCEDDGADVDCPVSCDTCDDAEAEVVEDVEDSYVFVDLNAVGVYDIPYSCDDGWNTDTQYQTVTVEDTTPPTIECECGCIEYYYNDCFDTSDFPLQTCTEEDTCLWDYGSNDELTVLPLDDNNCFDTIGTFTVTYTTYDAVGLSATDTSEFCIHDIVDCEIELNCDGGNCDSECNVDVEACTGTYVELGATATDDYDADIQSKVTTSGWVVVDATTIQNEALEVGSEIDETEAHWTIGTYEITYYAEDQSGNDCQTSRLIYVADTTPPVVEIVGDHMEIIEASVREDVGGATCTDTCTSLTATVMGTGGVGTGPDNGGDRSYGINHDYDIGPDNSDMNQFITFDIFTYNYEEMLSLNNPDISWVDEQQYYCNGAEDSFSVSDAVSADVVLNQPSTGSKADEMASQFSALADECALREVTYSCSDWVGNTATAIQYIATIDTIDPNIYYDEDTYYSSVYDWFAQTAEGRQATAAGGLVAIVGAVAFFVSTTQRRRGYEALPVV